MSYVIYDRCTEPLSGGQTYFSDLAPRFWTETAHLATVFERLEDAYAKIEELDPLGILSGRLTPVWAGGVDSVSTQRLLEALALIDALRVELRQMAAEIRVLNDERIHPASGRLISAAPIKTENLPGADKESK